MFQERPFDAGLVERIRRLSAPLQTRPVGLTSRLKHLPGVRAVLFDVYGTLFISASGDIGTAREEEDRRAFLAALAAAGLGNSAAGPRQLVHAIQASHAASRQRGIEYPEVDIVDIWRRVIQDQAGAGGPASEEALRVAAVEYECRTNPVWPMPGAGELLANLRDRGLLLGIVSNAQFYTPLMFQALLGGSPTELGFAGELCAWSYQRGEAKPATGLFRPVLAALLERHGVSPEEVLYVGNDRLKDIWPATRLGCRTALFAGDQRSLRLRETDQRCRGVEPDLILVHLRELGEVLLENTS